MPKAREYRRWIAAEDNLLGTAPDTEIAAQLGRDVTCVATRRNKLKIPVHKAYQYWTEAEVALLGTDSDERIANRLKRTTQAVRAKRQALGIIIVPREWLRDGDLVSGHRPARIALHPTRGPRKRSKRNLNRYATSPRRSVQPWSAKEIALLRKLHDREVARRTGRTQAAVFYKRHKLRIAAVVAVEDWS